MDEIIGNSLITVGLLFDIFGIIVMSKDIKFYECTTEILHKFKKEIHNPDIFPLSFFYGEEGKGVTLEINMKMTKWGFRLILLGFMMQIVGVWL